MNFGDPDGRTGQQVVVVTIAQPSNASFTIIERSYDTLIFLRRECDNDAPEAEIDCNDDSDGLASRIPEDDGTIRLEPGTYFLYLGGFSGAEGTGTVDIRITPI